MTESVLTSVLFTDLVDSTAIGARLGPERNEALRSTHFALLRAAIDETGGVEVKNLGDGLMVTYASPSGALAGAIGMQRAVAHHNRRAAEPLHVRMGLSVGEAYVEDDDYFGEPVVEAARLCGVARGGQILTTDVVRVMAGRRAGFDFVDTGERDLKGIPEPVATFEVTWDEADSGSSVPLPTTLVTAEHDGVFIFVGRTEELARVEQVRKDSASAPSIRTVLIGGEAGIGKSAMVARVCGTAYGEGSVVLAGHCDEETAAPYQVWVQALAHLLEHAPESAAELAPQHRAALARLVPGFDPQQPAPVPDHGSDNDRYVLLTAVEALLHVVSDAKPLILVLDDLHWADSASLHLLRHVLSSGRETALLVLATYRHTDLETDDPLTVLLADLHRVPGVARLRLAGLDDRETVQLVEATTGHGLDDDAVAFVHALRRDTDGNPFFTREILRHVAETDLVSERDGRWVLSPDATATALPASVRDVVTQRVNRVGDSAGRVLTLASVLGREFDLGVLADLSGDSVDDLLDVLDAATAAAILVERPDTPGAYRFSHALTQRTLYENMGGGRRARTHQRAAKALERSAAGATAAEVARHLMAATRLADSDRVLSYVTQAADDALASLAPHDAIEWYQRALDLVEAASGERDATRARLLIGLGTAQRHIGDASARETLHRAAELGRALGDDDLLIDSILAIDRGIAGTSVADAEWVRATEAALEAVGSGDSVARARLLSILSQTINAREWERRRRLCIEAVAIGRRLGDHKTLAAVLPVAYQSYLPDEMDERLAITEQAVALTSDGADPIASCNALFHRIDACMRVADVGQADEMFARLAREARATGLPVSRWQWLMMSSMRALLGGDVASAEADATAAFDVGTASGQAEAPLVFGTQLLEIRRHQGRLAEMVPLMHASGHGVDAPPGEREMLASVLADVGRLDEAAATIAPSRDADFETIPRDAAWMMMVTASATTAMRLADHAACRTLYEMLEPYADRTVATYATNLGSVSRILGRLAHTLGRHDDAVNHLDTALACHEAIGAPYWIARTQLDLCDALRARDSAAAATRIAALAISAGDTAETRGYAELVSRAAASRP